MWSRMIEQLATVAVIFRGKSFSERSDQPQDLWFTLGTVCCVNGAQTLGICKNEEVPVKYTWY